MEFYIIVYILLSMFLVLENSKIKYKKIFFYGSLILSIFFISFSYYIGADWDNYYINYKFLPTLYEGYYELPAYINFEIGFQKYTIFMKTFFSYDTYRIISSIVDIIITYKIAYKYSKKPITLMSLYIPLNFFLIEVEALRQAKAICIFLYSTKYIIEKKLIRYIILNMLGVTFHFSALILFPLYYFYKEIKLTMKKLFLILLLTYFFREILIGILDYIVQTLPFLIKYKVYLLEGISRKMTLFNILRNLCFTLPIIFMIKNEKKLKHEIKYYFIIRNFTLLFIILMVRL